MVFSEVEKLKKQLNCSMDVVVREVSCGGREINLIFIKSMIDENFFISGILSPIMDFGSRQSKISSGRPFTIDNLLDEHVTYSQFTSYSSLVSSDNRTPNENTIKYKKSTIIRN